MKSCKNCMFKSDGSCKSKRGSCRNYINQFEENEDLYLERYIETERMNFYDEFYEYIIENNGEQDLFY